jgi:hypothetical protein
MVEEQILIARRTALELALAFWKENEGSIGNGEILATATAYYDFLCGNVKKDPAHD